MLFNSYEFIFVYFPIVFSIFFLAARHSHRLAAAWLFAASLFFYGWWNPAYVLLLLMSIVFNFFIGNGIAHAHASAAYRHAKAMLIIGVAGDLGLLAYYKYANFFVTSAESIIGTSWQLDPIVLPLGISFFTFTQIAFLVDAYKGKAKESNPIHYGLFVTYFPHLIAGPVLHHKEMMPQFAETSTYAIKWENLSVGMTVFAIGLFKKVILADNVSTFAAPIFSAAATGTELGAIEAWTGALAYTLQLYFDFSGYSDMAIGLSRMFGVRLPLNFNSPYKAESITEFWRRWHMTLSRFLRDYLYVPLGGNRKGPMRRYINLLVTMVLGGLWHGAGWTFIAWGALHGAYLCVNHAWRSVRSRLAPGFSVSQTERIFGTLLTFMAVVVAWVFFRAQTFDSAFALLKAMTGANGIMVPSNWVGNSYISTLFQSLGLPVSTGPSITGFDPAGTAHLWIATLFLIVWAAPNSQQILGRFRPALGIDEGSRKYPQFWEPNMRWAVAIAGCTVISLLNLSSVSEFLYFQF